MIRCIYESVDDSSLSYAISQKLTKKRTHATIRDKIANFFFLSNVAPGSRYAAKC